MDKCKSLEIKKTLGATVANFCFACGHRYEVGTKLALVPRASRESAGVKRDNNCAHIECVEKHNAGVAKAIIKREEDAKKIATPRLDLNGARAKNVNELLALRLLERNNA